MRYISIIQKKGFAYFFYAAKKELRKKIFVILQRIFYRGKYAHTYSQYGEDLFLDRFFAYKDSGSYIDIGANHPKTLSNTKKFYDKGWRGVNIEPNVDNFKLFLSERKDDINLNVGVGRDSTAMTFYQFLPDTLSTFSKDVADELIKEGTDLVDSKTVNIMSLSSIFETIGRDRVDFISIDTEGFDMEVLMSNDWNKYRADVICIEDESGYEYDTFFKTVQYKKRRYNGLNSFFVDIKK